MKKLFLIILLVRFQAFFIPVSALLRPDKQNINDYQGKLISFIGT
jgi:hypothetical protein